jgi:hypothetical protein
VSCQTILHLQQVLIRDVELLLGGFCNSSHHFPLLLFISVNHHLKLHHFFFFLFLSLIVGFHAPLNNFFDFQLKSHTVIVD